MHQFLFKHTYHYRYLRLRYLRMFYYTYLEFHNRHDMYILSLMDKIVLLVVLSCPPWIVFCRKAQLSLPEIISNTALPYALGFNTISLFLFILDNLMIF